MGHHPKGCGKTASRAARARRTRESEGATWVTVRADDGSTLVRCKTCNATVRPAAWWDHSCPRPAGT